MPEWIAIAIAIAGGTGLGGIIVALINKRPTRLDPFAQLQMIVAGMQKERELDQKERETDRATIAEQATRLNDQSKRIDDLFTQQSLSRTYEAELLAWGAAGGPPPPPKRPDGLK